MLNDGERWRVMQADCLEWLRALPPDSLDLVFGSPPYEQARLYLENGHNIGISRKTDEWVAWMVEVYKAAQVACKGLVAFVVAGQTRKFKWSAGPALLMAELHRAGMNLRNPPVFSRVGIPGSGGPDWLRSDYEWIVCTARPGKLPWSDNTACGHPPKWAPGGEMSHMLPSGDRVNARSKWGKTGHAGTMTKSGKRDRRPRPSHRLRTKSGSPKDGIIPRKKGVGVATRGGSNGDVQTGDGYDPPALANPGNIIRCLVGGGLMGHNLAHANEAPFPLSLASFFLRSFCPPGGVVGDCFLGSGTTIDAALQCGRRGIGCDLRASQVELSRRRLRGVTPCLL